MSMIRGVMRKEDELEVMDGVPGVSAEEFQLAREKIQFCPKQFRFAVSGAGGTGKSSLINNFLNLGHEDGAPTGITEITFTIGRYSDPGDQPPRKWTVWYDIPGAGSFSIKTLEYFKQQCLFIFDLVLVVFDSRFEQINLSIIRDCRRFKIPSFIIRSKTYTQISHCMRSNGYDSDDDNDPEATKELRRISREHAVAETPKNVKEELQKAGFLLQRVYLVLISDIFRRAYAAFISDEKVPIEVDNTGKFVDERELIHDLMIAALARRCDIIPEPTTSITPEPSVDRERLISRLRTRHRGVKIEFHCKVARMNVAHVLVKCSLTKTARSKARKALGVNELSTIMLLYDEKGFEWAEKIWQTFMEASRTTG